MNAFVASEFADSDAEILQRGTLVSYVLPYAVTLELTGRLNGVVISGNHYNRSSKRPCVCPITHGETSVNEAWGIKIGAHKGIPSYLRPDLASFIGISYGQLQPIIRRDTHRPCIFPTELVRKAGEKLIDIIRPTPEKLAQRGHMFLGHGEIGWSDAFPRNYADKADAAPIMNLTAPEIYVQTGMVLVARGYKPPRKIPSPLGYSCGS